MTLDIDILTLFPAMLDGPLREQALEESRIDPYAQVIVDRSQPLNGPTDQGSHLESTERREDVVSIFRETPREPSVRATI
jgi:hypothetical protein